MNIADPDFRNFFEYCAARSRHRDKTILRFIQMEMQKKSGTQMPMHKLIEVFNSLRRLGIVELVGSGPNAEVHWRRNIVEVGKDALGGKLADMESIQAPPTLAESLVVDFQRDNGSTFRLNLPSNLTPSESKRLGDLVRALAPSAAN